MKVEVCWMDGHIETFENVCLRGENEGKIYIKIWNGEEIWFPLRNVRWYRFD
jgi:hypothetical protein